MVEQQRIILVGADARYSRLRCLYRVYGAWAIAASQGGSLTVLLSFALSRERQLIRCLVFVITRWISRNAWSFMLLFNGLNLSLQLLLRRLVLDWKWQDRLLRRNRRWELIWHDERILDRLVPVGWQIVLPVVFNEERAAWELRNFVLILCRPLCSATLYYMDYGLFTPIFELRCKAATIDTLVMDVLLILFKVRSLIGLLKLEIRNSDTCRWDVSADGLQIRIVQLILINSNTSLFLVAVIAHRRELIMARIIFRRGESWRLLYTFGLALIVKNAAKRGARALWITGPVAKAIERSFLGLLSLL